MRYFFTGATVAILLLTGCGPVATSKMVPAPPPATPTPAQTALDSSLLPEVTPLPPTAEPPTVTPTPARTTFDSPLPPEVTPLPPTAEPPTLEPEDTDKGRAVMGDAVIIYQRSGGFAGVHERWTVYPDGRIVTADGREWQVTPEQVEQLLTEIEAMSFFEMEGRYMPLNTCCDRFTYEVTVRSGDKVNTVTTIDAAPDAPPELWGIIEEITRLVSELQAG
jgi:hypothetical protein